MLDKRIKVKENDKRSSTLTLVLESTCRCLGGYACDPSTDGSQGLPSHVQVILMRMQHNLHTFEKDYSHQILIWKLDNKN
jgi:hypothetical protein